MFIAVLSFRQLERLVRQTRLEHMYHVEYTATRTKLYVIYQQIPQDPVKVRPSLRRAGFA